MTHAIQPVPPAGLAPHSDDTATARLLIDSGLAKDQKTVAAVAVKILYGRALGLDPVTAQNNLHLGMAGKGGITMSAALMAAMVRRSGLRTRVLKLTDEDASVEFLEKIDGAWEVIGVSDFSLADAKRAGISDRNPVWKQYPRNMLMSRAISNGVRWFCPWVVMGVAYTPDEVNPDAPITVVEGEIVYSTPEAQPIPPAGGGETMRDLMERLIEKTNSDTSKICDHFKVKAISDLSDEQVEAGVRLLTLKLQSQKKGDL